MQKSSDLLRVTQPLPCMRILFICSLLSLYPSGIGCLIIVFEKSKVLFDIIWLLFFRSKRATKSTSTLSFTKSTDLPCFPVTKKGCLSFSVHNCLECFFTYIVLGIKDSPYTVAFYNLYLNLKNSNKIKTEGNEAKLYAI